MQTSFLKRRYNFADISVLMRTQEGKYLNLTDLNLTEEKEYVELKSECDAQLLFCFCTFCKRELYAAPVTYEEVFSISRATKLIKSVTSSFAKEDGNVGLQIGLQIAVKKILESAYSYAEQRIEGEDVWYDFKRLMRPVGEDGKRKKVYTTVLSKKFIKVI